MRYIDVDKLIKTLFPIGLIDDGKYTISAKAVKYAIDNTPTADVVPKSEEWAECPTCHGTGRIGTTDWLTKNISKKQLAEEKAKAIAEHEQYIKTEYAREIFEEIEKIIQSAYYVDELGEWHEETLLLGGIDELKKKYTEG